MSFASGIDQWLTLDTSSYLSMQTTHRLSTVTPLWPYRPGSDGLRRATNTCRRALPETLAGWREKPLFSIPTWIDQHHFSQARTQSLSAEKASKQAGIHSPFVFFWGTWITSIWLSYTQPSETRKLSNERKWSVFVYGCCFSTWFKSMSVRKFIVAMAFFYKSLFFWIFREEIYMTYTCFPFPLCS